jgi:DNA-binding beta-propeller fold protein YncE
MHPKRAKCAASGHLLSLLARCFIAAQPHRNGRTDTAFPILSTFHTPAPGANIAHTIIAVIFYGRTPLPENWILGQVAGIAVDNEDNVWIIHRPSTLLDDETGAQKSPPETRRCTPAPSVLQFSTDGTLLKSWGGPGQGYDWPKSEHGLHIDKDGNVWLAGNDKDDHQILKFTPDGKFLQQIGKAGSTGGSNSTTQLGRPAHMVRDDAAGELYVADGYGNRRVIVFDAKTGDYKRQWGAYGTKRPTDAKLPPYHPVAITALSRSFSNPVHCVRLSRDGMVYVCDRGNDRIQVFQKDGTFVKEYQIEPETLQNGSVWDLVLSADSAQRYIFVADGSNMQILTIDRHSGERLGSFGRPGRMAGEFKWVHNIAIDSKGTIYTAEVGTGRRTQKFKRLN